MVLGVRTAALADTLRAKYRFSLYTALDYNPFGSGDLQRGSQVFSHKATRGQIEIRPTQPVKKSPCPG